MIRKALLGLALSVACAAGAPVALAQVGTAVTYQGQLKNSGQVVNSPTDVRFNLYDAATGGNSVGTTSTRIAVPVVNGIFSTTFDCGINPYTADRALWLQIDVRNPSNTGGWIPLGARQRMTGTPFSLATRGLNVDPSGNVGIGSNPDPLARLTTYGNVFMNGAAPYGLTFHHSNSDGIVRTLEIGIAGGPGHYSNSATIWDTVIRNSSGNAIHLQAGSGDAAMTITGSNTVGFGTTSANHRITTKNFSDDQAIRMRGHQGNFEWGAALRWGDSDFVRISEPVDDVMEIRAAGGINAVNTFSAPTKNFRIDHPSDPANKILNHGCIESDQYINLYRGNAVIGQDGSVSIQLPAWMNDLNTDFSYQLTSVGAAQPNLFIAEEVNGANQFRVAGGIPGAKVSWIITGVRHDAYVLANPLVVEQDKPADKRGTYINPNAFGVFTADEAAKAASRR